MAKTKAKAHTIEEISADEACCSGVTLPGDPSTFEVVTTFYVSTLEGEDFGPFDDEDAATWKQEELAEDGIGSNQWEKIKYVRTETSEDDE